MYALYVSRIQCSKRPFLVIRSPFKLEDLDIGTARAIHSNLVCLPGARLLYATQKDSSVSQSVGNNDRWVPGLLQKPGDQVASRCCKVEADYHSRKNYYLFNSENN